MGMYRTVDRETRAAMRSNGYRYEMVYRWTTLPHAEHGRQQHFGGTCLTPRKHFEDMGAKPLFSRDLTTGRFIPCPLA